MENKELQNKSTLTGQVVSGKMDKTIVVKTIRTYTHPVFHKTMHQTKKYKVHDEKEVASVGDMVEFYEGRPLSKTKYMYLSKVLKPSLVNQ